MEGIPVSLSQQTQNIFLTTQQLQNSLGMKMTAMFEQFQLQMQQMLVQTFSTIQANTCQIQAQQRQICTLEKELREIKGAPAHNTHSLLKSSQKLTLKHALDELSAMKNEWNEIGIRLGVPSEDLKSIETENARVSDRLIKMLEEWLKMIDPIPSWQQLAEVVEKMHPRKAAEIRAKYVPSTSQ